MLYSFFYLFLQQPPAVPDNRRQAESLSLTREVSQSRNPSVSEHLPDEDVQLFSKMRVLQEKKQKMDKLLGELHTLRDEHLNNSSCKSISLDHMRCRIHEYYDGTEYWLSKYLVNKWIHSSLRKLYNFCGEIGLACEKFLSNNAENDKIQEGGKSVL